MKNKKVNQLLKREIPNEWSDSIRLLFESKTKKFYLKGARIPLIRIYDYQLKSIKKNSWLEIKAAFYSTGNKHFWIEFDLLPILF